MTNDKQRNDKQSGLWQCSITHKRIGEDIVLADAFGVCDKPHFAVSFG
jgi:hypothetical protein